MDISQFESVLAKAKAYDTLKVKYDKQSITLRQIASLSTLHDEPFPVDGSPDDIQAKPLAEQIAHRDAPSETSSHSSFDPTPSLDGEDWKEVPRKKIPKKKHISGNKHGTDFTHNPCITEDQAILAGNQGIRFPKMIVKEGGKERPDVEALQNEVWHYGKGVWVPKHSQENPRWKCCLCNHHFENGYCRFPNDCMYAHSEEELRPFVKYLYGC
jgi:hypothetical protein